MERCYMIPATHGYARLRPEPGQAVSGRKRVPLPFFRKKTWPPDLLVIPFKTLRLGQFLVSYHILETTLAG